MTLPRSFFSRVTLIPAIFALAAPAARGQGFGLNEIGTCSVGRGFAVTGAPCGDATAIYGNPAALLGLPRNVVTAGVARVDIDGGFRADTTDIRYAANVQPALVPHFFANRTRGRLAAGIGVYVPYGLTSQWNGNFPGRFSALKASLRTVYIQPNLAVAITPNWSVGGGPVIGHSSVELIQSQDLEPIVATVQNGQPVTFGQLGIPTGTEFARAEIKGSAVAAGFHVGVFGHLAPTFTVGVRYLSRLTFDYDDADATFRQIPTGAVLPAPNPINQNNPVPLDALVQGQFSGAGLLTPQKASTRIRHPWQAAVGVGFTGLPRTTLAADVVRLGWSDFNELPLTFKGNAASSSRVLQEDYEDSWSYRIGADHVMRGYGLLDGVTLRAGFSYAETPAPDVTVTPLLPDMPRRNTSFGAGIPLGKATRLDLAYLYIGTPGRRGRIIERTSATQTAADLNSGAYDLKANVLSMTLTTSF